VHHRDAGPVTRVRIDGVVKFGWQGAHGRHVIQPAAWPVEVGWKDRPLTDKSTDAYYERNPGRKVGKGRTHGTGVPRDLIRNELYVPDATTPSEGEERSRRRFDLVAEGYDRPTLRAFRTGRAVGGIGRAAGRPGRPRCHLGNRPRGGCCSTGG